MWSISLPVCIRKRMQTPNKFISTCSRCDFNILKGFSSSSHGSKVLSFCTPLKSRVGRLSAHDTFCPQGLLKHAFLRDTSYDGHMTLLESLYTCMPLFAHAYRFPSIQPSNKCLLHTCSVHSTHVGMRDRSVGKTKPLPPWS